MAKQILNNDWQDKLGEEFTKPYYLKLREFLKQEYTSHTIYPGPYDIFNALHHTPFHKVKVVILGQDPYHGPDQAHGLSFSVKPGVRTPPSLQNIYKELHDDLGCFIPNNGYLLKWANQGVLMLNTVLTVREGQANSHKGKGWENFTDKVITTLNEKETPVVFLLWGSHAQSKAALIHNKHHYMLGAPHPSPLSAHRGFLGCRHFSKANEILRQNGLSELDWQIENR
ncbi:uracil-DNA glycosylase [Paenibacillus larvae subsp. pulvifaciens]|uniref:Uracil-DNA glycosylase n=1 Tax=Paenibacillus larvae subsp. pulvifaciens TaxID=1477 RepID=A0A1V0UP59_9BACL|nr:uracil-DNA glycosylase [Paenibacillus larvae]ARF66748.1 uracil-DNA glycosylase [Paenibacillus larvae subsp. pulvifaciens]